MLGPVDIHIIKRRVYTYLANSPTPSQKQCLKQAIKELGTTGVADGYLDLRDGRALLVKCDHIIEIFVNNQNEATIGNLYPAFKP